MSAKKPEKEKSIETIENEAIAGTIDGFRDRILALRAFAVAQLKHARENQQAAEAELQDKIDRAIDVWGPNESEPVIRARAFKEYQEATGEQSSMRALPHDKSLAEMIFIYTFAALDVYLGNLLRILFAIRPELLVAPDPEDEPRKANNKPSGRMVNFSDVLSFPKLNIITAVTEKVIDSLLRMSYVESFDKIANRFQISTLKEFENWPKFVECSQRRHLIVHCGGVVSSQYIQVCQTQRVDLAGLEAGQVLDVTEQYLYDAIEFVAETGLKVGQVLWRALRPSSIHAADSHLGTELQFRLLQREQWTLALRMGEFGSRCSERKYDTPRKERAVKVILVNYAQAAKWSGDNERAQQIVKSADWSASSIDFDLAIKCLEGDWEGAAALMKQVGNASKDMSIHAYYNWPIFREFRETPQFLTTFEVVFGKQFTDDIKGGEEGSGDPQPPHDGDN
jgi:hypothetical protein